MVTPWLADATAEGRIAVMLAVDRQHGALLGLAAPTRPALAVDWTKRCDEESCSLAAIRDALLSRLLSGELWPAERVKRFETTAVRN
jgi:hypothetical protein